MQEKIAQPELSKAIELAGELIIQAHNLLISKTNCPEELLANSYQEQQALREYEALLDKATNPDIYAQEDIIWDELFSVVINVIAKVRDMINSISCFLTGGFIRLISPRYPLLKKCRYESR